MLGGSSGINFMAYGRPSPQDVDNWEKIADVTGWSWDDLLPYYLKSEQLEWEHPNIQNRDSSICPVKQEWHGLRGPIHTSISPWQAPIEAALLQAFDSESGLSRPLEPWSGPHVGFYRSLFTIDRTGMPTRSYAANGYLSPALNRPNLKVLTNAMSSRILIDGERRATGVEFSFEGKLYTVSTEREVILCAGSIESPKLLEMSGIGDPTILRRAGISCLVPLPMVGENLQEKPVSAIVYELAPGGISTDSFRIDPALFREHQQLFQEKHDGALSGPISLMGFVPYASQTSYDELAQTLQQILLSKGKGLSLTQTALRQRIIAHLLDLHSATMQFVGLPSTFGISRAFEDCSKIAPGPGPGRNACYSIMFSSMYPVSQGSVHVQSTAPHAPPCIDLGLLSHSADVDVLATAAAFADRVFQSRHVQSAVVERVQPPPHINLQDRVQAKAYIQDNVMSYHHAVGSCSLGSVVDGRLRVNNVQGLRVVDASIIPSQVSHAVLATVYAVAEKGADLIKADYRS